MASRSWFRPTITDCYEVEEEVEPVDNTEERAADRERMIAAGRALLANNFESFELTHLYLSLRAKYYDRTPMEPIP